jgi:UPF0176 protein
MESTASTEQEAHLIVALYKFFPFADYQQKRDAIEQVFRKHQLLGTLLVAEEGINGTFAGSHEGIHATLAELKKLCGIDELECKFSTAEKHPFRTLRVRLKNEIVTIGDPNVKPRERVGTYVEPAEWNALIADPEVLVLDTRNDYEVRLGTFEGAVDPQIATFRAFSEYAEHEIERLKTKKVAMFCTGGIRCEKASSLLLQKGVTEVFHLRGGILRYFEEVPAEESTFRGDCYVFDKRIAVNHKLKPAPYMQCRCGMPIREEDKKERYLEGVHCRFCLKTVIQEFPQEAE